MDVYLAIVNCAAMNIGVHRFFWIGVSGFLGYNPNSGIAGSKGSSMDETGEHYAKWNKPGGEGQIPYNLTFNWNIINKRKKQRKYNQRHWGWEQSSSGQGGVGWGQWEEGIAGTIIKDTWTKLGGMVGGEGRGEKAYNCNWITIKFFKKNTEKKINYTIP